MLTDISAIDNATRALINRGQTPVTCGLWFSLGHSTIVIGVARAVPDALKSVAHQNIEHRHCSEYICTLEAASCQ
jgi:high-affinity nickel permease